MYLYVYVCMYGKIKMARMDGYQNKVCMYVSLCICMYVWKDQDCSDGRLSE